MSDGPSTMAANGRWSWRRAAAATGFAAALGLAVMALSRQWNDVREALSELSLAAVAASFLASCSALIAAAAMWRRLLSGLGSTLTLSDTAAVFFVSQVGKYLPGSLWPVVAQMELGRRRGVASETSAVAFSLAMLLTLGTGGLLALGTLPMAWSGGVSTSALLSLAVVPIALLVLHPRVANPLLALALRVLRRPQLAQPLQARTVLSATSIAALMWCAYGLHVWVLVVALGGDPALSILVATGGFALAWSIGFAVVFVPAGAGVREAALIAALSPVLDGAEALTVALVSRLLMTVADVAFAAVGVAASTAARRRWRPG